MKILALKGPSNMGKTTTLGIVYDTLFDESEILEPREQEGNDKNDFSCVLKYKNKSVALFTMGDYVNALKRYIKDCSRKQYNILIFAINDGVYNGCKVKEEISKHNPTIIEKTVVKEDYDSANKHDADKILAELSKEL